MSFIREIFTKYLHRGGVWTGLSLEFSCNSMNNLLSYCELVDAEIRASDKDLPVPFRKKNPNSLKRPLFLNKPRTFAQCRAGAAANISQLTHTKLTQLGL